MHFRAIFPLIFLVHLFCSLNSYAAGPQGQVETAFQQGLAAFQKSDFQQARVFFLDALKNEDNPTVLFNLGLTEQRLGNQGMAIALWRKALASNASFFAARRSLEWIKPKLAYPEIAHEVELWESLRAHALGTVSLTTYLLGCAVSLLGSGWLLLRYLGLRRQSTLDEKPMPSFPILAALATVSFFLLTFFSAAKLLDENTERATVVEKKVAVLSSPANDATPLFELYEGLEVIVRERSASWTQVTYPGGSTGWIPSAAILSTYDKVVR
jgi:tetratricopeptide (TPR) repeat protein